ncbi:MAG: hypothetical protein IJ286_01450 [Alistipes sp.]|nr:hypothetical protein [Alistipes sp.]
MKKFWSIFTVALVALSAVSCSNNFDEVATIEGETLSFNVNIDNTRTALEQVENVWKTVWVGNETLVVSDGEKSYNFTNTTEDKNKFSCEAVGIRSLIGKNVTVVYNSVINSAEGAAGMTLAGATSSFSETEAINMVAHNAFLKLTSEADVTLTASADIFGDGATRKNSIVVKGTDVLVPVYAGEVTLSATIAESKVKETTLTLADNKIYNLGTLEAVQEPTQFMASFNKVEYFAEPTMTGMQNMFMLAIADAAGNSAAFYFYNETAFLSGEYPVITMDQMGTVPAALIGGEDVSTINYNNVAYKIVGGAVLIQTTMPDMDNNLVTFQLELEDANGNKAVIAQSGESLISPFGYTGGAATSPLSLKDWNFTTYEATVDGTTVTLKSSNTTGDFVMVLSGVVDGNIAAENNFYIVGENLSGYYFDSLEGQFDFTEGGIWFEKMSGENNYQIFISPMYEWKVGNRWHVDNGLDVGVGLDIIVNFPVVEPVLSEYGVVGSFQGWDVANPVQMFVEGDWSIARGVELYKDDEIKVVKGKTWDVSYGPKDAAQVLTVDTEHTLTKGGQNVKVAKNGKFDIYFNAATAKFKYTCVEEYTNLSVNITIDNKANWSPLYIILKDGETLLTAAEGDLVTDNKFAVSGDYIGSSLSYQFVSGDKKSEPAFVTISKNGAAVTLEENVIKLYFQLDTDNAKQWWGTTSKIHVWNTGTSFDTSWPGTTMTSEGNYTWSVVVPSELVGKTINYLIHNGNGWQSDDATVTIKAEGVTVVGSSINVK